MLSNRWNDERKAKPDAEDLSRRQGARTHLSDLNSISSTSRSGARSVPSLATFREGDFSFPIRSRCY